MLYVPPLIIGADTAGLPVMGPAKELTNKKSIGSASADSIEISMPSGPSFSIVKIAADCGAFGSSGSGTPLLVTVLLQNSSGISSSCSSSLTTDKISSQEILRLELIDHVTATKPASTDKRSNVFFIRTLLTND